MGNEPKAILFDMVRCSGCRQCVKACMRKQAFPGDPDEVTELSATAYTAIRPVDDDFSARNLCRHCVTPSCASVCPVAALQKNELGPVTYDPERCIGCRYCVTACPFNIPRYEWNSAVPRVRKCDMCIDRIERGEIPACADACRYEATVFGTRAELLEEAHARIEEEPDEYYDHVYGEFEVGGTSVLFITPFPVESLGFDPALGTDPLPELTWNVLSKIPAVAVGGGAALMAFAWVVRRRNEVIRWETCENLERAAGAPGHSPRKEVHRDAP